MAPIAESRPPRGVAPRGATQGGAVTVASGALELWRRIGAVALAAAVLASTVLVGSRLNAGAQAVAAQAVTAAGPKAPAVEASSAVLMDAASGRVLYGKAPERPIYPASVTKILTAYVVLRKALGPGGGGLDAVVTVSRQATTVGGSSIYLRPGDQMTVRDLLYGLLLSSGNDAAEALAEHTSGSRAAFADLLNETARELGCTSTHFVNPSGMPARDQVTTALDLARMTRAALSLPQFSAIVATHRYTAQDGGRTLTFYNENRLLGENGVDGVKTGYTTQAGQTYVASATRHGMRLIAVVIGSSRMGKYQDARRLLDWGFATFTEVGLPPTGRVAAQTQVRAGSAYFVDLVVPPEAPQSVAVLPNQAVAVRTDVAKVTAPPIHQGQVLGTLTVFVGNEALGTWPLLAAWSVEPAPPGVANRGP